VNLDKVSFFIDGFNVFHSLKDNRKFNKYLWLDYKSFLERYVRKKDQLADIYYFSAYAYWRPDSVKKHRMLIDAWKHTGVKPVLGNFKEKDRFCVNCKAYSKVHEEKQTDVNIAIYLIKEDYENNFDTAILVANDTDLVPAIDMVKETFPNKKVGGSFPHRQMVFRTCTSMSFLAQNKEKSPCEEPISGKLQTSFGKDYIETSKLEIMMFPRSKNRYKNRYN